MNARRSPHRPIPARAARRVLTAFVAALATAVTTAAVASAAPRSVPAGAPQVIPAPTSWTAGEGTYTFDKHSRIVLGSNEATVEQTARTLAGELESWFGGTVPVVPSANAAHDGDVLLSMDPERNDLGDEGYELRIGDTVEITGATGDGVFYGTRTLLQMLAGDRQAPRGKAVDVPKHPERGLTLGIPVVHMSMPWFERLFREMAYLKLNVVLLEVQVQSDSHPEAVRWGYYTKDEVRRLNVLAEKYHITLIPEVNGPGHMDFYLHNHPELRLVDKDGNRSPGQLDITKPEAFDFYTDLVDEWSAVFDSPYWMIGADEYLGFGDDYSDYPQLAEYAKEKFGPDALPQDAFIDFVNRVDEYVRAKGLTMRMWNDGIPAKSTVDLNTDIIVEHWIDDQVAPSELFAAGHKVMNASERLYYDYGRGLHGDLRQMWKNGWNPGRFSGEQVDPETPGLTGAKISVWPIDAAAVTERQLSEDLFLPYRFLAQRTWGSTEPFVGWDAFVDLSKALGHAPGWNNVDYRPLSDGMYTFRASGDRGLRPRSTEPGSTLVASGEPTRWQLKHTADGYYRIASPSTGLCLDMRTGRHWAGMPVEPDAALTMENCDGRNTQKWEITRRDHGAGFTVTNAISQMRMNVADGGAVVQAPQDRSDADRWRIDVVAHASVDVDVAVGALVAGYPSTVTVTFTNHGSEPMTDLAVGLRTPDGWRVEGTKAPPSSVEPGESATGTWQVTPADDASVGRYRVSATASYALDGTGRTREVTGTASVQVVQGRIVTTPYYRVVVQTAPAAVIRSLGVDPSGGGDYRTVLDADFRATAPYVAVGSFGDTDRTGPAGSVRVTDDGRQVRLRDIPMGDEPVTVDWTFAFREKTFDFSLDWHVTDGLNAKAWEVAWSWDTTLAHVGDPADLDRGTGDVSGFPDWTIAYGDGATLVAAYKDGSAFAEDNHWFNKPEHSVVWQALWQPGGRTFSPGDYDGGTWRIGASGQPKDTVFADQLHEQLNG